MGETKELFQIKDAIALLVEGRDLTREQARSAMSAIMEGKASEAQIASLVTALRMKGETVAEITGFAETMRLMAHRVDTVETDLLDTCGTGGDGAATFNVSTAAAIVAAAGGIRVAKHGNRAMSSKSGSADVLEALGVNIQLDHVQAAECLRQIGICFLFAQNYHQSMKHAAGPRREIGIRTVFNLLGPLTNPAGADRQLLGVFDRSKTRLIAEVMRSLGLTRGLVVGGCDGLDEISISAPTELAELADGEIRCYTVTPEELGLTRHPLSAIRGGDAVENAAIIRSVLRGDRGACRDIVLANAGACFYVAERCETLAEGVAQAAALIDSGQAYEKLTQLIACTEAVAHVS
jgi:anthranilate phosphoribosyltransferase